MATRHSKRKRDNDFISKAAYHLSKTQYCLNKAIAEYAEKDDHIDWLEEKLKEIRRLVKKYQSIRC